MLTLNFLKIYPTWAMGVQGSGFSDKTYRNIIYTTIYHLSQLPTIHMNNRFDKGHLLGIGRCFLIIDSFPVRILRPKNNKYQNAVYSGKYKYHCLKYEVAIRVRDGKIRWIAGPSSGSLIDVSLTRKSGFLEFLLSDELVMADKAYKGKDFENFLTPEKKPSKRQMKLITLELWEKMRMENRILSRLRVLVENLIGRMKKFGALNGIWRGNYDFQAQTVLAVANITNFWIDENPLRRTLEKKTKSINFNL